MKTTTIAKYDINIKSIQEKIQQIQKELSSSNLQGFVSKGLLKDIDDLQKRLDKFRKTSPTSSSSSKDVEKYTKDWEKLSNEIAIVDSKLEKIHFSDEGIKENIKEVSELVKKYKEAEKAKRDFSEKIKSSSGVKEAAETGVYDKKMSNMRNKMAEAAAGGYSEENRNTIKELATSMRKTISDRITQVSSWGKDKQQDLPLLKQRLKEVTAIEQSALRYAELQQQHINNAEKINSETDQLVNSFRSQLNMSLERTSGLSGEIKDKIDDTTVALKEQAAITQKQESRDANVSMITSKIKDIFSVSTALYTVRQVVRGAIQDFQELDKQFNEIAIVSEYSTKEMWESFSIVNRTAQEFGVETKNVLEVQNLYYHQGKDMAEVNKLTAQTLTLAKITGMDYERATSDLTAALNAYNIAAEDAVRVTDTIAAMDTNAAISSEELMTALTKTASIAANAGMSLESTEVFLTKMIETTREAPENLGTALKTIIARFGQVKQEIDGEEIELADINKVDTALKTIGISLLDTAGQIRNLDDVFMELSGQWDDLDRNTQRYIATIAAGSRQQSRFIAMMEDYDRTLELTEIAQNSAGLGARQLAKAQESIETSVNRLKSTWQEFYSSLIPSGLIKDVLELANGILSVVNEANDFVPYLGTIVAGLAIWAIKTKVVDKVVLKLGQSIGTGIGQATGFSSVLTLLSSNLDDQALSALSASDAIDEVTKSYLAAAAAAKGLNTNPLGKTAMQQAGMQDEEGKFNYLGEKYAERKNTELMPEEWLKTPKGSFAKGKQGMLEKMLGKDGVANFLEQGTVKGGIKATGTGIKGALSKAGAGMKAGLAKAGVGLKSLGATAMSSISGVLGSLSAILSVLWPILAVVGAIGVAFVVWKKFFKASLDDTKQVEKLSKAQEEYNKQLSETNDLKEKAKKYEEYRDASGNAKKNLTAEQLEEEQQLAKDLVAEYPALLEKIDEEGKYHLKNAEAIQEEIDKKEELLNQSAESYNKLRLESAEKGVYADTSTQAGQAIKNIQEYAATFGTEKLHKNDDLKEIAEKVDEIAGGSFNKSGFYDIMEAYAIGDKFSFDQKDFTDLFAGDIVTEGNWNKFLQGVIDEEVFDKDGNIDEKNLIKALESSDAYTSDEAETVAETFIALNKELGGLYGQLLEGAAYEQAEIYVENAKLSLNQLDFDYEVGDTTKTAMGEAALASVKTQYTEEEWAELDNTEINDQVENKIEEWSSQLEGLEKEQLQDMEKLFNEDTALAANINSLSGFIGDEFQTALDSGKTEDIKTALETYWNLLDKEVRDTMPEMKTMIETGSEAIIGTIFYGIKEYLDDEDLASGVAQEIGDYATQREKYTSPERYKESSDLTIFDDMQGSQFNQWLAIKSNLAEEQEVPYLDMLQRQYNDKTKEMSSLEKQKYLNTMLNVQFTDMDSVLSNMPELSALGYTYEDVFKMMTAASNGAENIIGQDTASIEKRVLETSETFQQGIEGMEALMSGTASQEQLSGYFNTMKQYYLEMFNTGAMTGEAAAAAMSSLGTAVQATGKGFKLSEAAADQYGNSLYDLAIQSINLQVASLKQSYAQAQQNNNYAEMIQLQVSLNTLMAQGANLDAQRKQSANDALVDKLSKAKEKADQLVDSLKALVDWLRDYDRYANLDGVISTLEQDFEHLDFEISFSTNTDVIEKDLQEQLDNINTQIFANQGGIQAAEQEQAMWRDTISKRNSQYVSFDADGNAIVQAQELEKLQREISKASEERKPVLQAEYDEIMDNVEAYNKAKDKVNDYSKALEENFKALEDFLKSNYEAIMTVEDKLIDARMKAEDKELEAVKKKYDAIKDENDKYLEDIQEMIDKEREIRDRADREQDVKDKEKKLAMMKMDTSGVYANDIRALEEELEGDYRDLEDDAVDKAVADLEKEYQTQAEILDKEIEYLESSLEYRREIMTEYNQWAQEMMMQGSDTVLEYLKANDEEYYTGTAAAQANWTLEWNNAVARGEAANSLMASTLDPVMRNLETCKDNANGFEDAVQQYSETALTMNPEVETTVSDLVTQYSNLAEGVGEVDIAMTSLAIAYRDAADAAVDLKRAQDYLATGEYDPTDVTVDSGNKYNDEQLKEDKGKNLKPIEREAAKLPRQIAANYYPIEEISGKKYLHYTQGEEDYYILSSSLSYNGSLNTYDTSLAKVYKYAKGGYVDYTGPAWVDGTKSHPEYMLNATQTVQFETLVAALSNLYGNGISPLKQSSQKIGDAYYNFHINVDQMASDYDVDQLVSRLEEKMVKSSQYRNVTVLKKSQ